VDLAQKVKTAQKELEDAEAVARKLGGTVGRKGNAGMAVLADISRCDEGKLNWPPLR
ncbi:hypothetical protein JIN85_08565, partial [Luteolibacter pohnpeiensis]|nr:hypothetical protein [Luteolibacter pohnpeiensis]